MLPRRELKVGKGYINEEMWLVREVIQLRPMTVKYHTYHLSTGQLCGAPHECKKDQFIHWADREATEDEMANLQYEEAEALYSHEPIPVRWEPPSQSPEQALFNRSINR